MHSLKRPARWLAAVALVAAGLALALPAGAQSTGATLNGRVQDDSGGPLPGVAVTATNNDTGYDRTTVTGADGSFHLPALPAGTYTVKTELSGFSNVTVEDVKLSVATERTLDVTMKVAALEESITVIDEAPLVATSPSIGTVVSQEELENLPLNGRQFANLAVLAPGTTLGYNTDPTKPGQLVVELNGGFGRNVNYTIDGGDNTDDTIGGALQNFNLEAVQEFKIQTQQYKAEYGRTTGGVLSVVTKTGTNEFGGSVYGLFRDKSLNEETETEKRADRAARLAGRPEPGKQPYERKQYGASFGGPIVRDRAHFFATWEKTDRDTAYTVLTGGVLPALDGQSVTLPFTDELGTAKVTFDVSPKQFLQVRYGYQKNTDKYGATPLTAPSSLGTLTNDYKSVLVGHTLQLGSDMLNEALFQYSDFKNNIAADSNDPFLYFPSGVTIGQSINTPQSTGQTKYQYKDDLSFSRTIADDRHDFKVGVNYIHEPTLNGDFTVGTSGQFSLINDNLNSPVSDITFFGGFSGQETPVDQYGVYVQDDWAVNDRLTVNVGLRYDYWDGFDLDQRSNTLWQVLSTQTRYNEAYLRDFQGGGGGVLSNDDDNYAPRIGFTWDVKGDGRNLLRGGWGIYYDFPYTNATILFPASAVQSNYGVVYNVQDQSGIKNPDGSFFHPGDPLPPNQVMGGGPPLPNEVASPTLATPYSKQASLGYSWQVNDWLGLNIEGVTVDYEDIPFRFRANPIDPATGQRRFAPEGFNTNFRIWHGGGSASYDGVNLGFRVRQAKFELQGFYTYSEAEGNILGGADEFRLTVVDHQPDLSNGRDVSVNPLNPLCGFCTGPLNTDARHRFTIGGVYRAPWGINVSGMFRYRSALPYTDFAGVDLNNDGFVIDLPAGVSHPNTLRGDSFQQLDIRLSKEFTFGGNFGIELIAEMFNVLNDKNPAKFRGNRNSPATYRTPSAFAGDPGQGEQQLAQLGLRVRF